MFLMSDQTRRHFLGASGLAAFGIGSVTLRPGLLPTEPSGDEDIPTRFGSSLRDGLQDPQDKKLKVTERDILGPYFREGAPYRAKVTPPLAKGRVTLIRGSVWGFDTKKPLADAVVHIWQASHDGRYDNDDPKKPPRKDVFKFRARMLTDEAGRYEYETIHPGRYKVRETFRPSHIHYKVEAKGYKTLITQLYFKGDPFNKTDRFIKDSLIIDPKRIRLDSDRSYELGVFDIVLKKA